MALPAVVRPLSLAPARRLRTVAILRHEGCKGHARGGQAAGGATTKEQQTPAHVAAVRQKQMRSSELYTLGKFQEALALAQEVARELQSMYGGGEPHPAEAAALNNVAAIQVRLGLLAEALQNYERALAIYEKSVGKEHASYATALHNLALVEKSSKLLPSARERLEEALRLRKKLLGPRDPAVASSMHNLANVLREQGDVTRAIELQSEALKVFKERFG
jgi:tetratricopeptide (TPR) repeat protein